MNINSSATASDIGYERVLPSAIAAHEQPSNTHASAVSWSAILAGAVGAAALSLILLILGAGLGLSSVSPWASDGVSAKAFGVTTIAWLIFTQLAASAMGGYLAGRLRIKWAAVHTDEVYFRDTAHGFLAWAIATLATAVLLTSVIGSIVGTGVRAGSSMTGNAASGLATTAVGVGDIGSEGAFGASEYFVNSLFRKDLNKAGADTNVATETSFTTTPAVENTQMTAMPRTTLPIVEVTGIFMNSIQAGPMPPQDISYVAQLVAQHTGLTQQDAEKRVNDVYTRMQTKMNDAQKAAKDAIDITRKSSAYAALWFFISLLIGAFIASLAATHGGRQRDT